MGLDPRVHLFGEKALPRSGRKRLLQASRCKRPRFWHRFPSAAKPPYIPIGCGCSSGVEHNLAKVGVEGSNPFARSKQTPKKSAQLADLRACAVASLRLNKPRTVPKSVIDLGNRWAKCSRNVPHQCQPWHSI